MSKFFIADSTSPGGPATAVLSDDRATFVPFSRDLKGYEEPQLAYEELTRLSLDPHRYQVFMVVRDGKGRFSFLSDPFHQGDVEEDFPARVFFIARQPDAWLHILVSVSGEATMLEIFNGQKVPRRFETVEMAFACLDGLELSHEEWGVYYPEFDGSNVLKLRRVR